MRKPRGAAQALHGAKRMRILDSGFIEFREPAP